MSCATILVVYSSVTHERLDQISMKYHLVEEDRAVLLGPTMVTDRLPSCKVGFYLYEFEDGLHVPPSSFFGYIVESYKIHTC